MVLEFTECCGEDVHDFLSLVAKHNKPMDLIREIVHSDGHFGVLDFYVRGFNCGCNLISGGTVADDVDKKMAMIQKKSGNKRYPNNELEIRYDDFERELSIKL